MAKPLNIAHRGGAQLWPENTLFAFVSAAKAGFDGAELDVQLTRDGKLAVFHDFKLKPGLARDSQGRWLGRRDRLPLIRDSTLAELQSFDVGRPKSGSLYARTHRVLTAQDGERIPSLAEVIAGVRAVSEDFQLFVELKTDVSRPSLSASPEALAEAVVAELHAAAFGMRAVLVGFDWTGLIYAKRLDQGLRCWFTTEAQSRLGAHDIAAAGGDGWFCARPRANADAVRAARSHGLDFGVWTVDDLRGMRALIALGADAICTDRPDRLQSLLR